ncbi:protein of unknown function [Pseudomonas sp. JV241A]|nr:protein of unknown function [Pseudomonas sp. JV241A]
MQVPGKRGSLRSTASGLDPNIAQHRARIYETYAPPTVVQPLSVAGPGPGRGKDRVRP